MCPPLIHCIIWRPFHPQHFFRGWHFWARPFFISRASPPQSQGRSDPPLPAYRTAPSHFSSPATNLQTLLRTRTYILDSDRRRGDFLQGTTARELSESAPAVAAQTTSRCLPANLQPAHTDHANHVRRYDAGPSANAPDAEPGGHRCNVSWMLLSGVGILLTGCSWGYLQAGISRIMLNLQDGIDMQTVSWARKAEQTISLPSLSILNSDANDIPWAVYGSLHVSSRPRPSRAFSLINI